ncbi:MULTISPECIES: hypothetical protein [unclassified Cupriavidus]|uniref:hypothetical protein n=1 Tax=unclassified Cupriavidus TaxID=2640874 RepID=UPI0010FA2CE5|nr:MULTISPECIES: hypothetical protein [unclassified Cupriavidus]MWL90481.1 hypothetical protein [Cupriavidus sp. SW-Y-13]
MTKFLRWRVVPAVCAAATFGALAMSWAVPSHAYFDTFMNGTIIGTLDKDQTAQLVSTFGKTLSETDDKQSVPFQLPPNAKGIPTEGSFTPLVTRTENGQRCRKIRSELRQRGRQPEKWVGWYCQQPGGEWKKTMLKG